MPDDSNCKAGVQSPIRQRPGLQAEFDIFEVKLRGANCENRRIGVGGQDTVEEVMLRKQEEQASVSCNGKEAPQRPRAAFSHEPFGCSRKTMCNDGDSN